MTAFTSKEQHTVSITQFVLCTQEQLARVGFEFLGTVNLPNNKTGVQARLPHGWSLRRINKYQVEVFDTNEQNRCSIIDQIKNPAHENNGALYLGPRFYVWNSLGEPEFKQEGAFSRVRMSDHNQAVTLYETAHVDFAPLKSQERIAQSIALDKECEKWLDEHYPLWRDPTAYWDAV